MKKTYRNKSKTEYETKEYTASGGLKIGGEATCTAVSQAEQDLQAVKEILGGLK